VPLLYIASQHGFPSYMSLTITIPAKVAQARPVRLTIKIKSTTKEAKTSARPVLKDFQIPAKNYLIARDEKNLGGALYMEMRLGKTVVMCDFISEKKPNDINLVLCPYQVMETWRIQLEKFGITDVEILDGEKSERIEKISANKRWFILNYEMAEKLEILSYAFQNIIIDESIRVSNPTAKITKYLLAKGIIVPRVYVLAGNPFPENRTQIFSQMIIMQRKFMGESNFYSIRSRYFENFGYDWVPKESTNDIISTEMHKNCFVLSRKQAGLPDLKERMVRKVKMTPEQRKAFNEMLKNFEYNGVSTNFHLSQLNYLQQISGGYDISKKEFFSEEKIKDIFYLLKNEFRGEPVMIWCRFTHEVEFIAQYLRGYGIECAEIYGEISKENRNEIRLRFNAGKIPVVVATIKSLSKGTDWSGSDTSFYYSNEFSYDERSQSEDRIYHLEKDRPSLIIDFVTENSVDEEVLLAISNKNIDSKLMLSNLMGKILEMKKNV
jgi:superfamily II DNA or RNA helicase